MDKTKFLLMIRKNSAYSFVRTVLVFFYALSILNISILFAISVPQAIWTGEATFSMYSGPITTSTMPNNTSDDKKTMDQGSTTWKTYPVDKILSFLLLRVIVCLLMVFIVYFFYQSSLVLLDIGDATMHSAYVQHLTVVRTSKD